MIFCFYCTNDKCMNTWEQHGTSTQGLSWARRGKPCPKCGKKGERDLGSEGRGYTHHPGLWPMKSQACGVNPIQREEAIAEAARLGVPTHFDHEGNAIFTSPKHRKEYCERHGFFDRNAGYGDPQKGAVWKNVERSK